MNPDDVRQLVTMRMRQAEEALADSRNLHRQKTGNRPIVNRAYYAAFYAVLALMQIAGETPRKHKGALILFDLKYVVPGHFSRDSTQRLHRLFELRMENDYEKMEPISDEEASDALAMAERFVGEVREYLIRQGHDQVA